MRRNDQRMILNLSAISIKQSLAAFLAPLTRAYFHYARGDTFLFYRPRHSANTDERYRCCPQSWEVRLRYRPYRPVVTSGGGHRCIDTRYAQRAQEIYHLRVPCRRVKKARTHAK